MEKPSRSKAQPLTHPCLPALATECPAVPGTAEGMETPSLSGQPVPVFNSFSMKKFLLLPKEEGLGSVLHSPCVTAAPRPEHPVHLLIPASPKPSSKAMSQFLATFPWRNSSCSSKKREGLSGPPSVPPSPCVTAGPCPELPVLLSILASPKPHPKPYPSPSPPPAAS